MAKWISNRATIRWQNECINPIKSKIKQCSHDDGCNKWLATALIWDKGNIIINGIYIYTYIYM